jgi:hypothetical protein
MGPDDSFSFRDRPQMRIVTAKGRTHKTAERSASHGGAASKNRRKCRLVFRRN